MTPSSPFHFAFFVRDLDSTRQFYGGVLGCTEGRSTSTWVDFDFFGNQISAHTTGEVVATQNTGFIDGVAVPMPHFGAILQWDLFQEVARRAHAAQVKFILEPHTRYPGQPSEQMAMFVLDPSGNPLEFKSFREPGNVFAA